MQKITLIAAMDKNFAIGINNDLPWDIPEEMQHFKDSTRGKPVIFGRRSFESINSTPLPGRPTAVVSQTLSPADNFTVCRSLKAAIEHFKDAPEIMICGGSGIYAESLPLCTHLLLTFIDTEVQADTFFPAVNWDEFERTSSHHHTSNTAPYLSYTINSYKRIDF